MATSDSHVFAVGDVAEHRGRTYGLWPAAVEQGEIAAENAGKIKVVKLNIDDNPETARAYQIMSIPTMSVFVNGEIATSIVGAKPKAALLRDLSNYL